MSKYLELAKKLKALAEGGTDHEKNASAGLLEKLVAKHSMSMEELEDDIEKDYFFKLHSLDLKATILTQICYKVVGANRLKVYSFLRGKKKVIDERIVKCASYEAVDIESQYAHYMKKYEEELTLFTSAFVVKNALYDAEDILQSESKKLTLEEKQRNRKIREIASQLNSDDYNKLIE